MDLIILFVLGALAGIVAGLLGVGGGIIIIPILVFVLPGQGVDMSILMHTAIGTSLATIVVTSIASTYAHHSRGTVHWEVFRKFVPGIVMGALLGSFIAGAMSGEFLRYFFIGYMFLAAYQLSRGTAVKPHRRLPGRAGLLLSGTIIGAISSLLGIGGGTMSVPYMTWCNLSVRKAVATSAAMGLPIALAGAMGYIVNGWNVPSRPEWSLGYVNMPAFLAIVVGSTLFAPLGAGLAHKIAEQTLKRIFAVFLVIVAIRMLMTG